MKTTSLQLGFNSCTTGEEKHFCLCTKKKQKADPEGIPVASSMHSRTSSLASSELLVEATTNSAVRLQFLFCVQFRKKSNPATAGWETLMEKRMGKGGGT